MDLFTALEASAVATALRGSVWAYPLVNTAHVLGVALLFGAIVPLDLRLLGVWADRPVETMAAVLVPVAAVGLMLAVCAGALLFSTRASDYATSPLFLVKMVFVATGVINAVMLRRVTAWRSMDTGDSPPMASPRLRGAALVSLACWFTAITLGRLVGYF